MNMDYNYPVPCPLLQNKLIDSGICFDIHMVVCGEAPTYTAPADIFLHSDYKTICENCRYHRDD